MYYNWGVNLITLAFSGYVISSLLYLIVPWINRDFLGRLAYWTAAVSFAVHTTALTMHSLAANRLPFATMQEFILLFAWGIALIYLFVQTRFKIPLLGLLVLPITIVLLAYASALNSGIRPLMPALQSYWLHIHVAVAVLAYGAFAVSFCLAVLYLLKARMTGHGDVPCGRQGSGKSSLCLPALDRLDNLLYRAVAFGFPFMTLVLITGAVWAEQVWGRYWSWDPKETWALITWIIYALYLHARFTPGWRGRRAAWMAVVGFAAVIFTLFGVTIFMPGLHSYG